MNNQYSKNRINYLEKTYKDTNVAKYEKLSKETRAKINRNYYKKQVRRTQIQGVLNQCNSGKSVEEEVFQIIESVDNLKQLCYKCREEQIISVIVLFVQRRYNTKLQEEKTRLWRKYDLNWKLYGRIISNLLRDYRKNSVLPRNID